jgi:alcohol dehydrogenase
MPLQEDLKKLNHPTRIIFKEGAISQLDSIIDFSRIVLITSKGSKERGLVQLISGILGNRLVGIFDDVLPNPTIDFLDIQLQRLKTLKPDVLLAVGGGSCIDTAKSLARMMGLPKDLSLREHLTNQAQIEMIGNLKVIAVPTTAGSGSEVTPFATVWDLVERVKHSISGSDVYPALAILDPELTSSLPDSITISSGFDTVSHALESIWNVNAIDVTKDLARKSLALSLNALANFDSLTEFHYRRDMMEASLLAGLAISHTRTSLAHSISYPITMEMGVPHGIASSFTLPILLNFNSSAKINNVMDLASSLHYVSVNKMAESLAELYIRSGAAQILKNSISNKEQVLGLTSRMFHPDRVKNNIREVSNSDVQIIVSGALDIFL